MKLEESWVEEVNVVIVVLRLIILDLIVIHLLSVYCIPDPVPSTLESNLLNLCNSPIREMLF